MAKDGIHAFLFVISLRSCFSKEEEAVLTCLKNLLGEKITDYVIVVFSGGDELDDDGVTLEEYLGNQWPETLQVRLLNFSVPVGLLGSVWFGLF